MRYCQLLVASAALAMSAVPAIADQAACETDARAAMLDVSHPVPMRQNVTTQMAGATIKSAALSTPDGRGMALDADDTPTSLWIGGRFYTTADGGKTWSLLHEQTPEQVQAQADNLRQQAENATDIVCDYGVTLDGRTVNHLTVSYVMAGSGVPVKSQYWVDVETGFPWQVVHDFGGANPSVITQINEPRPDLSIDDPQG